MFYYSLLQLLTIDLLPSTQKQNLTHTHTDIHTPLSPIAIHSSDIGDGYVTEEDYFVHSALLVCTEFTAGRSHQKYINLLSHSQTGEGLEQDYNIKRIAGLLYLLYIVHAQFIV